MNSELRHATLPGAVSGVHHPRSDTRGYIWAVSHTGSVNSKKIFPDANSTEYLSPRNNVPVPKGAAEDGALDYGTYGRGTSPSFMSTTHSPPASARSMVPASGQNNIGNKTKLNPSFYSHLIKLESWANLVGANLLAQKYTTDSKGRWKPIAHYRILIFTVRLFLLFSLIREFFGGFLVDETDSALMLYIGDFSNIYGVHVDRFAFNAFKFCWGLHATVIYFWLTKGNGKIRKWLANFESRWLETGFYVNKSLENESLEKMRSGRVFAKYFVQTTSSIATSMVTALNIYGYLYDTGNELLNEQTGAIIYFTWCLAHMVWFWLTFVINMTAFGHHFLLCRAIHIRFDETKKDLEYAILSEWSSNTRPEHISGLITKHYYVCDMVKQANKHLKIYLFIFYIIFAPHLCLMIYQIMFSTNSTTQGKIFMGFLLILSDFFQVYSVSVLSAQITTKSHEPYYAMHGVNKFDNLPENVQLQSTLFMQRISNTVVGLTILDSFVLTGGLISSLVTAIVTYFSVILESA